MLFNLKAFMAYSLNAVVKIIGTSIFIFEKISKLFPSAMCMSKKIKSSSNSCDKNFTVLLI